MKPLNKQLNTTWRLALSLRSGLKSNNTTILNVSESNNSSQDTQVPNSLNTIADLPFGLSTRHEIYVLCRNSQKWQVNIHQLQHTCVSLSPPPPQDGNNSTAAITTADLHDNPCAYKWIQQGHKSYTSDDLAIDLKDATPFLEPYLVDNPGWSYECNWTSHIQPGWYAHEEQARWNFIPSLSPSNM
jgi:hypothetical protein